MADQIYHNGEADSEHSAETDVHNPSMSTDTIAADTSTAYNFFNTDSDDTGPAPMGERWGVGDHTTANTDALSQTLAESQDQLDGEIDSELISVIESASEIVEDTSLRSFECSVCGLHHSHSDQKHVATQAFGLLEDFAESGLQYNQRCHCGVNELSMLMGFFTEIDIQVFEQDLTGLNNLSRDFINRAYAAYTGDRSVAEAVTQADPTASESLTVSDAGLDRLRDFFELRQDIDDAADSAPIPEETRNEIDGLRSQLEQDL